MRTGSASAVHAWMPSVPASLNDRGILSPWANLVPRKYEPAAPAHGVGNVFVHTKHHYRAVVVHVDKECKQSGQHAIMATVATGNSYTYFKMHTSNT